MIVAQLSSRMSRYTGGFVKSEIIEPLGLLVTAAAQVLGVTRATPSTLLNEHSQLSSEMELRIEKAFGVSMDTLMRMQNSYDIAQARGRDQGRAVQGAARRRPRCCALKAHGAGSRGLVGSVGP
jgi:addiction module HigA family antidote